MRGGRDDHPPEESPDNEVFQNIMEVLQSSFVFKGIKTAVLNQLVKRMKLVRYAPADVIVQQGDQASPSDCMYYIVVCPAHVCAQRSIDCPAGRKHKYYMCRREGSML